MVFGCFTIWAWPWLVGSLFSWTRSLRPFFKNQPVMELLLYSGTGMVLIRLSLMSANQEAELASKRAIWAVLQWFGYRKWFAEMLARGVFSFMSGASRGMLMFVGTNLLVNALPDNWRGHIPSFVPAYMHPKVRGTLHASDVELIVFRWSQRALFAFCSSLLGYCLLQFKQAPETPVPESEGRKWVRDRDKGTWSLPGLACLVYARQHPEDKRARHLMQRVALPDRVMEFAVVFGLIFLPWTYLLGFRPQTVLAVGGVGGLAVGLAAQNLVGNLISGVLINLNRPFGEGDEIEAGGRELQGIVEDVGFTVTRINRLDGVRIHVPNARLLDGVVVNRTVKDFRSVQETIPVVAPDLSGLTPLVERVQTLLDAHPEVLQSKDIAILKVRAGGKLKLFPPVCAFTGYGRFGAELFIQAYMRGGLSNPDFMKAKSDLMLQVNKIVSDCGMSIGFGCSFRVPQVPLIEGAPAPPPPLEPETEPDS